ncbi:MULTISPECIES: pyrroloquinoline quinone-dependent dehydrogenase [unclassified Marinobacter]|uniref:pyrroloquinoline quinone-dependent dehydrogenase n=1 Tax=unclassified Marinobacter TaxID=83889 RepID=UPI0019268A7C|nr:MULTISPECIES: pyrroloquinoline quinone-dependent dehydrogenase [unclassified Marinobacter]MBL3826588.1 pyrroloquinoline quinone-dependent dehydrogenase [Marinobacter sp. MC3]MBL3895203.1 pyrroloquinoline quinone-dependent dehydrogenase [Marinobacter sp. MW3]
MSIKPIPSCRALVSAVALASLGLAGCATASSGANWVAYDGDKTGSKFSKAPLVTKDSVENMEVVWEWSMPDNQVWKDNPDLITWMNQSTPLAIDGVLYSSSPMSFVSAIDGETGETLWTYDPKAYTLGTPPNLGFISRGLSYWEEGEDKRIIAGTSDGYLIALNAETGKPIDSWGENGKVDLTKGYLRDVDRSLISPTSPPIICGGKVIPSLAVLDSFAIGRAPMKYHPPGDVQAFDVETGERSWVFRNPPQAGELGNDSWETDAWKRTGGMNVWARPSCDDENGLVFLPVSTPTNDFYGGERPGDGLFGDSLVALDVNTGKVAWHFQITHHGVWDYDPPTAPNLMDLNVDGERIKAVVLPTKQGFLFAFDRLTGEPIWPIEERPVPKSDVPGEKLSPTQPFPTKPAAYAQQGVSEDDLIDLTPELKAGAQKILNRYNYGELYTPPSLTKGGTLQVPGVLGGSSWTGAAHNPDTNVMYVNPFKIPFAIRLKKEKLAAYEYTGTWAGVGGPMGLPLLKPPFSSIVAIDMDTGEHLWRIPAGKGPVDHPAIKHLNLDRLGVPRQSHFTLTDEVLFVAPEGTYGMVGLSTRGNALVANASEKEEEPFLYAHDADTGELISEVELPGGVFGAPMSYSVNDKHYVVLPVGGAGQDAKLVAVKVGD